MSFIYLFTYLLPLIAEEEVINEKGVQKLKL